MTTRRHDGTRAKVHDHLEPVVRGLGLVLDDVLVSTVGTQLLLRVVVDLPPDATGALSLDAIADVAREVSLALDDADPMGASPYTLEVSSPGVERPLTEPRHLRRNIGRLVLLTLVGGDTVTGRVLSISDDDVVLLLLQGAKKGMPATKRRELAWAEVAQGVVQVEFNRPGGEVTADSEDPDDVEDDDVAGDDNFDDAGVADDDTADADDTADDDTDDGRS